MSMSDLYEKRLTAAKKVLVTQSPRDCSGRKWVGPLVYDSYGSESNRIEFYVFEGSPPRGVIVGLPSTADITLYGMDGKKVRVPRILEPAYD